MIKKLKLIIPITILILISVAAPGIRAYFIDSDSVTNNIVGGSVTTEIVEEFDPPEKLTPGVSFTKDVKVENTGTSNCYVRIKAVFENSRMEQYCEIDWNNTDWIYDSEDGYWYYTEIVQEGQSTSSLFTTISIKNDAPEAKLADFNIIIYAEGVESHQGQGFASYAQAWSHYQKNKLSAKG